MKQLKRKKKVSGWNIASAVVLTVVLLIEGFLAFQVWKLKMIPTPLFLILLAVLAVIPAVLSLLLFQRTGKWEKKKRGHGKQIVAYILCAVLVAGCLYGCSVLYEVNDTLTSITSPAKVHVLLEVYVMAEDPAQAIEDTGNYVFGISDSVAEEDNQGAIADIEKKLGAAITTKRYPSVFAMIDGLYAGEVNAIILEGSYMTIMDSVEGYEDFSSRVRFVHEHVIEKEVPQMEVPGEDGPETMVIPEVQDITKTPFLLYISGNDARRQYLADGGSDVNIMVVVNPNTRQVLMINTPRDYYVPNPASGNDSRDKLSHCGLKGINNSVQAMTKLYGHTINYYAKINFSGFKTLVDAMGGVTVDVEIPFNSGTYYFHEGENYMNGDMALSFVRVRKAFASGDNQRGKNQMRMITGMINKLSSGTILTNYGAILDSLEGMFVTSMPADQIGQLVQMQLIERPSWDIKTFAVTGDNGNDSCWAVGGGKGYVMYPHEDEVEHASDLIGRMLNGEVITDEDLIVK